MNGGPGTGGHRGGGRGGYPGRYDPRQDAAPRQSGQSGVQDSVWQRDQSAGRNGQQAGAEYGGAQGYDDGQGYSGQDYDRQGYPQRPAERGYGARSYGQQPGRHGKDPRLRPQPPDAGVGTRYPAAGPRPYAQRGSGTGPQAGGYEQDYQAGDAGYRRGGYDAWGPDSGDGSFVPGFDGGEDFAPGRGRRRGSRHEDQRGYEDQHRYGDQRGYDREYGAYDDQRAASPAERDPRGPGNRGPAGRGERGSGPYGRDDDDRASAREARGDSRPRRRRRSPIRRLAPWIALLVIVVPLAIGGVYIYGKYEARYHPPDYAGAGTGPKVMVQIASGEDATQLAPTLVQLGVVASDRAFILAAESSTDPTGLEPGFYMLDHHMKASLAYAALLNPKNRVQTEVTIPEGKRASQVIAILAKDTKVPLKDFQQVLAHPAQLGLPPYAKGKAEGYLFPATYPIEPHETALQILQTMVTTFKQQAQSVNLTAAAKSVGLTPTQVIIEASLAQAEGGAISDYPKIAEVIHNRLASGMHLQFDSTVLYGLGKYAVSATYAELQINTPYNTYMHPGLPAGPICNPGLSAINAILHPDHGNYLYFLTVPGGKSQFSASPLKGQ